MASSQSIHRASPDSPSPTSLLRVALAVDASACAGLGLALVAANGFAARVTGIAAGPLAVLGVVLVAVGAIVAWIAFRKLSSRLAVLFVVDANLSWAIGSVAFGWFAMDAAPTFGRALVVGQGLVAGVLAMIEWWALRRSHVRR